MKKAFKILLAVLSVTVLALSCEKEKKDNVFVSISADAEFVENFASVTLTLSKPSASDITIALAVMDRPSEGNSCVPADKLSCPESVVINAGSTSLKLDLELLEGATGSEAVVAVTGLVGAILVGDGVIRIKTGMAYNGGGQGGGNGEGGGGGEGGELSLQLQSNWSVSLDNIEFDIDDEGYVFFWVDVDAPGSTYFYVEAYTDEELQEGYGGSVSAMIQDYSSQIKANLTGTVTAADILYTQTEGYAHVYYYEPGPSKFYIMDFDAQGNPTGKYGVTELTIPEYEGGEGGEGGGEGGDDEYKILGPLTLQTGWKAVYSGNYRIDVSGVTDKYFMFDIYEEPFKDSELAEDLIAMVSYNVYMYEYVYDGPADYDEWDSIEAGTYYVYIAGLDDNWDLTGNYAVSTITVGSGGSIVGGGEDMVGARRKIRFSHRTAKKLIIRKR